jgi:hypothetical protein
MSFSSKDYGLKGSFIQSDLLHTLIDEGIPVTVQSCTERVGKFGPEFALGLTMPNPETGEEEEATKTFPVGSVESRDSKLRGLQKFLSEGGEPWVAKFTSFSTKNGNTVVDIVDADEA